MKSRETENCIFCAIAAGRETAHKVFEDGQFLAFLDRHPLFPGHVLLIPRLHVTTWMEVPDDLLEALSRNIRLLSDSVCSAMHAEGIFIANNNVVSQRVPHFHVHIVPRRKGDGLKGFFWPRQKYADEAEMSRVAAQIREEVSRRLL